MILQNGRQKNKSKRVLPNEKLQERSQEYYRNLTED